MSSQNPMPRLRRLFFFVRWRGIAAWLGPLLLVAILTLLYFQGVQWGQEVDAIGRRERLRAIDSSFLDAELLALQRSEERDELPDNLLEIYWGQYLNLVAGTGREEAARTSRSQSRARRAHERHARAAERREEIEGLIQAGRPIAAVDAALKLSPDVALTETGRAVLARTRKELSRRTGLVLVDWRGKEPAENTSGPRVRRTPFLIEARAVSREEYAATRLKTATGVAADASSGPATGVSFEEACAFAASRGRRLPSPAEREEAEREIRLLQPPCIEPEPAGGSLLVSEWVQAHSNDELARCGYGWCFTAVLDPPANGSWAAVCSPSPASSPASSPAAVIERRRMDRGHGDVGFRCAVDLATAVALERDERHR